MELNKLKNTLTCYRSRIHREITVWMSLSTNYIQIWFGKVIKTTVKWIEENVRILINPQVIWSNNLWQRIDSKKTSFLNTWFLVNCITTSKKLNLDPYFILYTKANLKWLKNLDKMPESIKHTDENISRIHQDLGLKDHQLYDANSKGYKIKSK